jgi:thioredoxin 1
MKDITSANWQEDVLDQPLVLVDFWASWCAPCKMQLPILEELERDIAVLNIVKVNADENPDLVEKMNVGSIPTLALFKEGEHIFSLTGAKPKGVLLKEITPFV